MRMEPLALFLASATAAICWSCGSNDTASTTELHQQMIGKVFGLADTVDAETCQRIPTPTDYWIDYLFPNDSTFIEIVHFCCNPSGDTHCTGKYRLKGKELLLRYDPLEIIFLEEEVFDSVAMDYHFTHRIERKVIRTQRDTMDIRECGGTPYFVLRSGSWKGDLIALSDVPAQSLVETMQANGVWEQLKVNE